jgi:EpsI family protein
MACIIVCASLVAFFALYSAAYGDDEPLAFTNRLFGLVIAEMSLVVGFAMMLYSKPGETQYCTLVFGMTIAAVLTGAYSYKPAMPQEGQRAEQISRRFKGWVGHSQKVDESTMKALKTRDIIMRTYVRGADSVTLAVIFSQGKRRSAHPPEQCYKASGNEMEMLEYGTFAAEDGRDIDCKRLLSHHKEEGKRQAVLYWYKADDLNTASLVRMSIHTILADLMMSAGTRVALIRLSVNLTSDNKEERAQAFAVLDDFAKDALPEIEEALARTPSTPSKPPSTKQE